MTDDQPNSQPSQLDKKDLNKLEEVVSENNACSSSMQSGEVNTCLWSTSETCSSFQAIMPSPIHKLYS